MRVAVVGAGRIAQVAHLPALARTPEAALAGVFDPRAQLATAVARRYGVRSYDSLEQLLADETVEALHLCVPIAQHEPIAVAALRAGKHVLVEKPLASTVGSGRRILAAAGECGRRVMVGYHKRYDAGCRQAHAWMPEIGRPTYLFYRFGTTNWLRPATETVLTSTEDAPAPVEWERPAGAHGPEAGRFHTLLLDMFTHMTNLLRWLTGLRPEVEWVRIGDAPSADGGKWNGMTRGILALRFGTAPALLVEGPHYGVDHDWNERCEVWGTAGRIEVDFPPNAWHNAEARARVWRAATGHVEERAAGWTWAFQQEAAHFTRCLRTGDPFHTEGSDALIDLEIVEESLLGVGRSALGDRVEPAPPQMPSPARTHP